MSKQSYVSIERGVCVVCGRPFEAGSLMLEKQLTDASYVVGWELCKADAQMHRMGFVALVECELDMSRAASGDIVSPEDVHRTGAVMHVTRATFVAIFRTEARPSVPCAYVPEGTLQKLQAIMHREIN